MTEKRKAGRPKAPPTEVIRIRLPLPVHAKVIERGGDKWVKRLILESFTFEDNGATNNPERNSRG